MSHPNRRDLVRICLGSTLSAAANPQSPAATPQSPAPAAAEPAPAESPSGRFVSDLSRCLPAAALTRAFEPGRWQLLDYETHEGVKGVMAAAYPEPRCPELTLPLDARGPHKIYLGINYTKSHYPEWSPYGQLDLKLTADEGFRRVGIEAETKTASGALKVGVNNDCFKSIQEAFWRTADLTGQSLVFRQPQAPYDRPEHATISNLSYVRLVPLTPAEAAEWERDRRERALPDAPSRRLAMIFCTGQFTGHTHGTYTYHPTSGQWFADEFGPYRESDFKFLVFEAMRGNFCLFRTRTGDVGTPDNRWDDRWVDPLAAMTAQAHRHGMRILASLRFIGPQYPMNREPIARARNYRRHPEWARRDRDGVPLSDWSLAYPEVCAYWLTLLRESLAYGTDGVQLHLNRSTPFVYYEEPVVRAFRERYGEDPRRLPESDPRWQDHCAAYVTSWLREVRKLVDEKPGRTLAVTVYGEPNKYDKQPGPFNPKRYNTDVEAWLRETLVDYVMPSPKIELAMLKRWRALAGARVHIWPDLMPRSQPAEDYVSLARKYRDAGADGFCVWDGERRAPRLSEFGAVCRLGDFDRLDRLAGEARASYRRVPLKYLDGLSVDDSFMDG